jgi:L-ribulokinase
MPTKFSLIRHSCFGEANGIATPSITRTTVSQIASVYSMPDTEAHEIYRANIETTAFGALTIIKRVEEYGVKIEELQSKVTAIREKVYHPIPENEVVYRELYALYRDVHDAFGMADWSGKLSHVMKKLLDIRARQS